jgi:predicted RNase H-like HicB family nuclease
VDQRGLQQAQREHRDLLRVAVRTGQRGVLAVEDDLVVLFQCSTTLVTYTSAACKVSDPLQVTIRFESGEDGWIIAWIPEVPGALSQGRTREEARANAIDALRLMLTPGPDASPSDSEPLQLTIVA